MIAVFKRELRSFFTSPVGFVILAALFGLSGFFFYSYNLSGGSPALTGLYSTLFYLAMLLIFPILAMRAFSEEKRQKTDQALLTSPVSLTGIVVGKFLAIMLVFTIGLSITILFSLIIASHTSVDWAVFFGNYIGLLLMAALFIPVGMLISLFTESQFVAALGTFIVSLLIMMISYVENLVSGVKWMVTVLNFLAVSNRYDSFTIGLIRLQDVLFFITVSGLILFLCVRVLDSRRWS
ncbi:MAG: ABC transporter permease [Oscillospiraceae bacterium]|nr:ABC transporter permease [Oscillospiraceae bacterium]